jgi:hypothetical protein
LHACDRFVFYDDVQHMPRGWVHRNRLLIHGAPHTFTVPLAQARQSDSIVSLRMHDFAAFRRHFLKQVACAYRRAPYFEATYQWLEEVLDIETPSMATLAIRSVTSAAERLGLARTWVRSSEHLHDSCGLGRAERLALITLALGGRRYVNSPGGRSLYREADFEARGVALRFVQPSLPQYAQCGASSFVPGLSIIDAFMHLPVAAVTAQVQHYRIEGDA